MGRADTAVWRVRTDVTHDDQAACVRPILLEQVWSPVGQELNGYVIESVLSSGAMGTVYLARHPRIGLKAAVKVLKPEQGAQPDMSARFVREARAMSAIRHPNIVEVLNFGTLVDGQDYLMMELVEGESLQDLMQRECPMAPKQALQIAEQILSALVAAHSAGVVHCDLKPANVMVWQPQGAQLQVKVLDFGLARMGVWSPPVSDEVSLSPHRERCTTWAGTPEYSPPEQAQGWRVEAPGDLYSLGVMLFEMLSGRLPFAAETPSKVIALHANMQPPDLGEVAPTLPARLVRFVHQLLEKDPAQRPRSALVALRYVQRLRSALEAARPPARHLTPKWAAISLSVLGALAATAWARRHTPPQAAPTAAVSARSAVSTPAAPEPMPELPAQPAPQPMLTRVSTNVSPASPRERAPTPMKPRTAKRGAVRPSELAIDCSDREHWRDDARQALEVLEQQAIAQLSDDADPKELSLIKARSRTLATQLRSDSDRCRAVNQALMRWRSTLEP